MSSAHQTQIKLCPSFLSCFLENSWVIYFKFTIGSNFQIKSPEPDCIPHIQTKITNQIISSSLYFALDVG